jgi:hypothetical protein
MNRKVDLGEKYPPKRGVGKKFAALMLKRQGKLLYIKYQHCAVAAVLT